MGGMKKRLGKFFRKLGIGKKKHKGGHDDGHEVGESGHDEVAPSNQEVAQRLSENAPQTSSTPMLSLVSRAGVGGALGLGPEGDNAKSEVDSEFDDDFDNALEEAPEEDGGGGYTLSSPYTTTGGGDDESSEGSSSSSSSSGSVESLEDDTSSESVVSSEEDDEVTTGEEPERIDLGGGGYRLVRKEPEPQDEEPERVETGGGSYQLVRKGPQKPVVEDDESSDDSSLSDLSEDEPGPIVVAPTPGKDGPQDDVALVDGFLAGESKSEAEVLAVVGHRHARLEAALKRGRKAGLFWRGRAKVHSRVAVLREFAQSLVQSMLAANRPLDERQVRELVINPKYDDHPLKKDDVVSFAIAQGYVGEGQGGLEVKVQGLGMLARSQSRNGDGKDRVKSQETQGWSTLGVLKNNYKDDKKRGVQYNQSKEQREPTVLKLQRGVFSWAGTGEKVSGPDLSGLDHEKDHQQIFENSPNYVVLREKELMSQGMWGKQAYLQAIQEVQNSPRLIFVMDAQGTFYASEAKLHQIHHSTLLGGLDVAAAGELALSGGKVTYVSDASGHYMPGPAYTWQALHEMGAQGVSMGSVDVRMFGVNSEVKADWFLRNFVPGLRIGPKALSMVPGEAVKEINTALSRGQDEGGEAPDPKGRMGMTDTKAPSPQLMQQVREEEDDSSDDSSSSWDDAPPTTQRVVTTSTGYKLERKPQEAPPERIMTSSSGYKLERKPKQTLDLDRDDEDSLSSSLEDDEDSLSSSREDDDDVSEQGGGGYTGNYIRRS